ncbi:MAG: hypothetical protein WCG55_01470 [bacterium]
MRSNNLVGKGKKGINSNKEAQTIAQTPQYLCARESCLQAGLKNWEIGKIESACSKNRVTASLRVAALLAKAKVSLDEIVWLIRYTKENKTAICMILAIATIDIEAINIAEDLFFASCEAKFSLPMAVSMPAISDSQLLSCAIDACRHSQLSTEQIACVMNLSENKKVIASLQSASLMSQGKVPFERICAVLQVATGYRANVLRALAYMHADQGSWQTAMKIFDEDFVEVK